MFALPPNYRERERESGFVKLLRIAVRNAFIFHMYIFLC